MLQDDSIETVSYKDLDERAKSKQILLEYQEIRRLLGLIARNKGIEVDDLKLILVFDYRKRLDEAKAIIDILVANGLVKPIWSGHVVEYYRKKSRKNVCRNVYCSLDEDPEKFNMCCEKIESKIMKLVPTDLLMKILGEEPW